MRVWLGILCCLLLMSGCRKPDVLPQTAQFSCDFSAQWDGVKLAGVLKRGAAGTLTISVHTPESLNGLSVTMQSGAVTVSLGDLQLQCDTDLPQDAVPRLICGALDAAADSVSADGVLQGRIGDTTYCLQTDAQTGFVQTLDFKEPKLECIFTNVQSLV